MSMRVIKLPDFPDTREGDDTQDAFVATFSEGSFNTLLEVNKRLAEHGLEVVVLEDWSRVAFFKIEPIVEQTD